MRQLFRTLDVPNTSTEKHLDSSASKPPTGHDKDQYQLWKSCPPNDHYDVNMFHRLQPISGACPVALEALPQSGQTQIGEPRPQRDPLLPDALQLLWKFAESQPQIQRPLPFCQRGGTRCITKRRYGGFYGYPLNHWWNSLIIRNNMDDFGVPHLFRGSTLEVPSW